MENSASLQDRGRDVLHDIGAFIRSQRESAQLSLRGLAERSGISNPYLSQVERGLRRPSAEILTQIAQGLSVSAESLLTLAGVLPAKAEQSEQQRSVEEAIVADDVLSDRQKSLLIDTYRMLRESVGASSAATSETGGPTRGVATTPTTDSTTPEQQGEAS